MYVHCILNCSVLFYPELLCPILSWTSLSFSILNFSVLFYRELLSPILSWTHVSYTILNFPVLFFLKILCSILSWTSPSYSILNSLSYPILNSSILFYPELPTYPTLTSQSTLIQPILFYLNLPWLKSIRLEFSIISPRRRSYVSYKTVDLLNIYYQRVGCMREERQALTFLGSATFCQFFHPSHYEMLILSIFFNS